MAVIFRRRVFVVLREQTRPSKGHETPETRALTLVSGVVDMWRRFFDQQTRELEQKNANGVASAERVVRVDDFADKDADDVVWVVLVGRRRSADEFLAFTFLKGVSE